MSEAPSFPTRRTIVAGALVTPMMARAAPLAKVCTILGDSIAAGYGLSAAAALPAQLQAALVRLGQSATVRGAGVSGDTSASGLARVDFSVQSDTRVCVVELGANDVLRGLSPATTQANLSKIIERLKARRIRVVLAGLAAPADFGGAYGRDFGKIFPALAKQHAVTLYPNLLDGVMLNAQMNQADGIHPNAAGVQVIARRLAPVVAKALA